MGLEDLDLFGTDFLHHPHRVLDRLRGSAPVHFDAGTGLWLVSRYADVRSVFLAPETFLPDNAQQAVTPLSPAALRVLFRAGFSLPPALANNHGAGHAGLRRVVSRLLTAGRVAALVPMMERTALRLLADAREQLTTVGHCDLVATVAAPLPCRVMMELFGVEGTDLRVLAGWSDDSLELFWGRPTPARQLELAERAADFYGWIHEQVRSVRPGAGGDSLVAALVQHRDAGGGTPDTATIAAACYFTLIAGHSTTAQLLGTVLREFLAVPQLRSRFGEDAEFRTGWVEEVLRREPSVTTWRRITARPVELAGVQLPAGAHLLLMLMGTGSDPDVFPSPSALCPGRPNTRQHLSFGVGRHRCPGALLARTEAATLLRAAARTLPEITVGSEPPDLPRLLSFRGPRRLVVRADRGRYGVVTGARLRPRPPRDGGR